MLICLIYTVLNLLLGYIKSVGLTSVRGEGQTLARSLRLPLCTEPTSKMVSTISTSLEYS